MRKAHSGEECRCSIRLELTWQTSEAAAKDVRKKAGAGGEDPPAPWEDQKGEPGPQEPGVAERSRCFGVEGL